MIETNETFFVAMFMVVLLSDVVRFGKPNYFLSTVTIYFYLYIYGQYFRLLPIRKS